MQFIIFFTCPAFPRNIDLPNTARESFSQEDSFSLKLQLSQDDLVNGDISQEDSFSLNLELSQDDFEIGDIDDLSSPCISPTPSLLASPIHSDSDSDLRKELRLKLSSNRIFNASPDLFEESDSDICSATHFSPEIMPLHSVENLRHSPQQNSENKARAKISSDGM